MKRYRVTLSRPAWEYADVIVSAESERDAEAKALEYEAGAHGPVNWEGGDADENGQVLAINVQEAI